MSMTTPSSRLESQSGKLRKEERLATNRIRPIRKTYFKVAKRITSIKILTIIKKLNFHNWIKIRTIISHKTQCQRVWLKTQLTIGKINRLLRMALLRSKGTPNRTSPRKIMCTRIKVATWWMTKQQKGSITGISRTTLRNQPIGCRIKSNQQISSPKILWEDLRTRWFNKRHKTERELTQEETSLAQTGPISVLTSHIAKV